MIMKDYITNDDTIIFNPRYNKPLDSKLLTLSKYKKIIFSDYELSSGIFEAYENENFKNLKFSTSDFNYPLSNLLDYIISKTFLTYFIRFNQPLNNCTALTVLVFGWNFNCPLYNSLDNCTALTHIKFGYLFNQPLDNSLDNCTALTHIVFGTIFNQPLLNSFNNCTSLYHIGLGSNFNQKNELPFNIKSLSLDSKLRDLSLDSNNMNYMDHLSDNIEEIELGSDFNLELNNLPSSIKKIKFNIRSKYNKKINCLPNGLLILQLPACYDQQISLIPSALTKLICS